MLLSHVQSSLAVALGSMAVLSAVGCASSTAPAAPPAAPEPVSTTLPEPVASAPPASTPPAATSVARVPAASSAANSPAAPPDPTASMVHPPQPDDDDGCHLSEELARAYERMNQGGNEAEWTRNARAKLISRVDAQRAFTGISQEILSAIAHRRYDKLVAFASEDGICMRAAKGAPCQMLTPRMLAGCAKSGIKLEWPVDGPESPARYSCGEAFRRIFYARDFLHDGKAHFNCFPEPGRGNNPAPIIVSGPRLGYVELYTDGDDGYRSLWLVYDGPADAPELVEMISDYPAK